MAKRASGVGVGWNVRRGEARTLAKNFDTHNLCSSRPILSHALRSCSTFRGALGVSVSLANARTENTSSALAREHILGQCRLPSAGFIFFFKSKLHLFPKRVCVCVCVNLTHKLLYSRAVCVFIHCAPISITQYFTRLG